MGRKMEKKDTQSKSRSLIRPIIPSLSLSSFFCSLTLSFTLVLSYSCTSTVEKQSDLSASSWEVIRDKIISSRRTAITFAKRGPFKVVKIQDYKLNLTPNESILADAFLPQQSGKSPLIMIVHGNKFNKLVHGRQCQRLGSWGFNCLAIQVPNQRQWIRNGKKINQLVKMIKRFPMLISNRINAKKIILVGHSFGGSAVTIAVGKGAPVVGMILLDPAVVHPKIQAYMKKITVPVVLLGADPDVFTSRKRRLFYKNISGPMSEVTVTGATHKDAQYPSINEVKWGFDLDTTGKYQEIFLQSMIASAFSLASDSNINFAWKAFAPFLKNGRLKYGRVRSARRPSKRSTH